VKHLHCLLEDAQMAGLDELVKLSDARDRSYFVRQAVERYIVEELPKLRKKPSGRSELSGLIQPKK